jgi:hypothetical protein
VLASNSTKGNFHAPAALCLFAFTLHFNVRHAMAVLQRRRL